MVLKFYNVLTLAGGSPELRRQCLDDTLHYLDSYWSSMSEDEDGTVATVETRWAPIDNALLDMAAKYLALDFEVEFRLAGPDVEEWQGILSVVDQVLFFQDTLDAPDGIKCGSIYDLKAKGGFPECLEQFLDS